MTPQQKEVMSLMFDGWTAIFNGDGSDECYLRLGDKKGPLNFRTFLSLIEHGWIVRRPPYLVIEAYTITQEGRKAFTQP